MRDYFDALVTPARDEGPRHWHARLQRTAMVWIDLAANACPLFNTRQAVSDFLIQAQEHAAQPDQQCLYFIASRKRLRFASQQPRWQTGLLSGSSSGLPASDAPPDTSPLKLTLWTEEGRERSRRKVTVALRDISCDTSVLPCVSMDDRYIGFTEAGGQRATWAIHDFFQRVTIEADAGIGAGASSGACSGEGSKIHYIGCSGASWTWPLVAPPAGLIDMMLLQADGDRDFFIVSTLFAVTTSAPGNGDGNAHPRTMAPPGTSHIDPEAAGVLLEKALLFYFQPPEQLRHLPRDESGLRDALGSVAADHRVASLTVQYGMDNPPDYVSFYTSREPAQRRHVFRVDLTNGEDSEDGEDGLPRILRQTGADPDFPVWTARP